MNITKVLNKIISFLLPELALSKRENQLFSYEENLISKSIILLLTPIFSILYIVHFYYIDAPKGLPGQSDFWMYFRFGCSASAFLTFIFYIFNKTNTKFYFKIPFFLMAIHFITMQSFNVVYDPNGTTFLPYFFVLIAIFVLRMRLVFNVFFAVLFSYSTTQILLYAEKEIGYLISHCMIVFLVTLFLSYRNNLNIKLFKTNQENIEVHKKLIERQIEMLDQIKKFLPAVIFKRFNNLVTLKKISSSEALDKILRPREVEIVCFFSDIRNFTVASRDINTIQSSIIPRISATSELIEKNHGISRKIGDLVFAYFDDYNFKLNIQNSLNAALLISQDDLLVSDNKINRSLILTSGKAIVGNIGGETGFEITAIGSPANYSARIDEYIKKNKELNNHIVLSRNMYENLDKGYRIFFKTHKINEEYLIRNFEKEEFLYILSFQKSIELLNRIQIGIEVKHVV